MMGCGKSTAGRLLGEKLNDFNFVDLDKEIQKEAKKPISKIFEEDGEEYFRSLETNIIKKFCGYKNQVIATGGGAVEKSENMVTMKENGLLIYLKASVDELFERVKTCADRPMLNADNPKERMRELMVRREPYYLQADHIVNTEKKELNDIVNEIIEITNEHETV